MNLTPQHLWASMGGPAKGVFLVLILMLMACVYVGIERLMLYTRARSQSRALGEAVGGPLGQGNIEAALKIVKDEAYKLSYLGVILRAGLEEYAKEPSEFGLRALKRAVEIKSPVEVANLRTGMNILATTGSTAPFVGLVGTIFGIINAFAIMATAGGGDLTAISGGISEALVSTAVGITVAIVAIWIYNWFNAILDDIQKDMTTAMQEIEDWGEKDLHRRDALAAK
ncbi:MAG: MotA/TolQ/ExbB proton channel family protein [Myxococcales bacterium]|nr:MotA/TolQ/ExbB proton channel family protein [Myxococcales bacterium]